MSPKRDRLTPPALRSIGQYAACAEDLIPVIADIVGPRLDAEALEHTAALFALIEGARRPDAPSLHPRHGRHIEQADRMTALCQTVPYLRDRPGFGAGWDTSIVFPGDPDDAHEYGFPWAWCHSSAAVEAVRFARHVWNASHRPPSLGYWDARHRAAFVAWARDPWWC